jgi:hypothetical protein
MKSKAGWRQPGVADPPLKSPLDPETILARTVLVESTKRFERLFQLSNKRATGNIVIRKSLVISVLRK